MNPIAARIMPNSTSNSALPGNYQLPEGYKPRKTNWTSVRLLNVYRLGLAAIFFSQSFIHPSPLVNIANLTLYSWTSFAFLVLALVWMVAATIERRGFQSQVLLQIYGDTIIIILLMHACGGISSGLGMLLIISVAVSGLPRTTRAPMTMNWCRCPPARLISTTACTSSFWDSTSGRI